MKYFIDTNQTTLLNGIEFDNEEDVLNSIIMFDLIPPFKIMDDHNKDVSDHFISLLKNDGYQFVDKKKAISKIPIDLQKTMAKHYKHPITFKGANNYAIYLVMPEDIKSINGFYELWRNNCISIGYSDDRVVFFDDLRKSICMIDTKDISDLSKREILSSDSSNFIKGIKNFD